MPSILTRLRPALMSILLPWVLGCPGQGPVEIGAVLPLTGEYELYGQAIRRGLELAFEELGRDEATADWTLALRDSGGDAEKSGRLVHELYEGGAIAVVGGVTTDEALASVTVADRFRRVLLSPSASSAKLTGASKNFYRVFISDGREGRVMAQFAVSDLEAKTAVVLAKQTTYARGIKDIFKESFVDLGGELLDVVEYPDSGVDLTGLIERATTLEPDAVYLAGYAYDIEAMIEGLRDRRFSGAIMTTAAFAAPEVIDRIGASAEGVFLTQTEFDLDSEIDEVKRFVASYTERHGQAPDLYAAHGYDALKVLVAGIRRAEGGPREVWSGLRALRGMQGATGALQFDEKGDVQKFPRVYRIHEGELVDYKRWLTAERDRIRRRWAELQKDIDRASDG